MKALLFGLIAFSLTLLALNQFLWAVVAAIAAVLVVLYEFLRVSKKYAVQGYENVKLGSQKEWEEVEKAKGSWPKSSKFVGYATGEGAKRTAELAFSPPSHTFQFKRDLIGAFGDGAKNFWKEFFDIFKK